MRYLVRILKSLSDETRLRIFNMLYERECCVCEIIDVLNISQPRASHHLGAMYNAGLLKMRRVGIYSLYSIDRENLESYAIDILKAVREGLEDDEITRSDLVKLHAAQRLIPSCFGTAGGG